MDKHRNFGLIGNLTTSETTTTVANSFMSKKRLTDVLEETNTRWVERVMLSPSTHGVSARGYALFKVITLHFLRPFSWQRIVISTFSAIL